ncbi:hypothetical protein D3C77_694180 [compost metagenome]
MEVAEGISLAQGEFTNPAALPEQAVEACFDTLVDRGAGVELGCGQAGYDLDRKQFVPYVRVVPGQVPATEI